MKKAIVFVDAGFLSKLSKHLGKGEYIKFKIKNFINNISLKHNFMPEKIFYYTARPSKLFVGNFVRGNSYKIGKIEILKNKKSHENLTESLKSEKFATFFQPNSWHEKVLNI